MLRGTLLAVHVYIICSMQRIGFMERVYGVSSVHGHERKRGSCASATQGRVEVISGKAKAGKDDDHRGYNSL